MILVAYCLNRQMNKIAYTGKYICIPAADSQCVFFDYGEYSRCNLLLDVSASNRSYQLSYIVAEYRHVAEH
jgi:hypothetical protein